MRKVALLVVLAFPLSAYEKTTEEAATDLLKSLPQVLEKQKAWMISGEEPCKHAQPGRLKKWTLDDVRGACVGGTFGETVKTLNTQRESKILRMAAGAENQGFSEYVDEDGSKKTTRHGKATAVSHSQVLDSAKDKIIGATGD